VLANPSELGNYLNVGTLRLAYYPMLLLGAAIAGDTEPPGPAELVSLLPAVYVAGYGLWGDDPLVLAALRGSGGGQVS
jgi:hypothetical protein